MESKLFDSIKSEKERAIARFNRSNRLVKLWQVIEVVVALGLVSWCSTRAPAVLKLAETYFVEFSYYLSNHHIVFLIGNAIIFLLLTLFRKNDVVVSVSGDIDFYDDCVRYSEATMSTAPLPPLTVTEAESSGSEAAAADSLPSLTVTEPESSAGGGEYEKQIVVHEEEEELPVSHCDYVGEAIEQAAKQIKRFQRSQSDILRREIAVRRPSEYRRSETENFRREDCSDAVEIENMSGEEFQRRINTMNSEEFNRWIDGYIYRHKKGMTPYQLEDVGNYQLQKIA